MARLEFARLKLRGQEAVFFVFGKVQQDFEELFFVLFCCPDFFFSLAGMDVIDVVFLFLSFTLLCNLKQSNISSKKRNTLHTAAATRVDPLKLILAFLMIEVHVLGLKTLRSGGAASGVCQPETGEARACVRA